MVIVLLGKKKQSERERKIEKTGGQADKIPDRQIDRQRERWG